MPPLSLADKRLQPRRKQKKGYWEGVGVRGGRRRGGRRENNTRTNPTKDNQMLDNFS